MLKKSYKIISFILIGFGLFLFFIEEVKMNEKIKTFEVSYNIIKGEINTYNTYLGILEIPKINLKQKFYTKDSPLNTVEKNIELIETSQMPTEKNANLILAAHSGNSKIGYFKNLDKLNIGDIAYINYNNQKYTYTIQDIYDVHKTGYIEIKRDKNKKTLTLITCKKNSNMQTVYIGYLK